MLWQVAFEGGCDGHCFVFEVLCPDSDVVEPVGGDVFFFGKFYFLPFSVHFILFFFLVAGWCCVRVVVNGRYDDDDATRLGIGWQKLKVSFLELPRSESAFAARRMKVPHTRIRS